MVRTLIAQRRKTFFSIDQSKLSPRPIPYGPIHISHFHAQLPHPLFPLAPFPMRHCPIRYKMGSLSHTGTATCDIEPTSNIYCHVVLQKKKTDSKLS